MKRFLVLIVVLVGGLHWTLFAAGPDEEQKLITVLQSAASPAEKDEACARLKFIGTSRCVPALTALLTDDQLSHSARYALEPMRFDEAGSALLDALGKTKGLLQVGIINSLAEREEVRAVPNLIPLLQDPELNIASASARALGQIGGAEAVKALRVCSRSAPPAPHEAAVDGLLRCANRLLDSGQRSGALAIYEQLDHDGEKDSVRIAAFNGRVRASGNAGLGLVLPAISGPPVPAQSAALQLVRELQVPNATKELANLLPGLTPAVQIALVAGLDQRGDPSAVPALTALAKNALPEVRVQVIHALENLGDATLVPLVAGVAASGSLEEQKAARQALNNLHRGGVTDMLIEQLSSSTPAVQAELAHALGSRGDKAAVPRLVDLAQRESGSDRKSVLQALSLLVGDSDLSALVGFVVQAKEPAVRTQAAESLNSAYQRIQIQNGHVDASPLVQGLENGSNEARAALLPICGGLVDPKIRTVLRTSLGNQDPMVRSAAVHALSDTTDPELLPDLLNLARSTQQDSERTLAISGGVRLVTQEETVKLSAAQRAASLKSLFNCASRPEQKRKVLAGLGEVPDVEALGLVQLALDDNALKNEAARAAIKITAALLGDQSQVCETALKKALAAADDAATRQAVLTALKQIQENSDYLTNWEVAGPYQQAGKDYAALFEVAFPPEMGDSKAANWRNLPSGSDPKRPWVMDLLKTLGGEQRVAYARTWLYSDHDGSAVLELGSDDGVKVWLNNQQVYSLNVARPLQPGSDKVHVNLHAGRNPLLLKITQNSQGWEFCVRIRKSDGSHLDGVRCESSPNNPSPEPK